MRLPAALRSMPTPEIDSSTLLPSVSGLSASIAWRLAGTPTYCLDGQVYTANP